MSTTDSTAEISPSSNKIATATQTPIVPPWLLNSYHMAGVATGVAAVIALIYAMKQAGSAVAQSRASAEANSQSAKTARAIFLFELDKRWEGQDMAESRLEFSATYEKLHSSASAKAPAAGNKKHHKTIEDDFAIELSNLRNSDVKKYYKIMQIMGFLETAGMLVRQGYIPESDILELYAGSILRAKTAFSKHIADLAEEKGALSGMYEHSLWLFDKAQKFVEGKAAQNDA